MDELGQNVRQILMDQFLMVKLKSCECFTLITQFMMAKWDFQIWEKAVTSFGLKQLEAFKLFDVLCKVCDDFEKSEAAHTTPTV